MRKLIKISFKVVLGLLFLFIAFISYTVYQFETSIDIVLSNEQKTWLYNEIENSEQLPESYIQTIEKYYPDYFENNYWKSVIKSIITRDREFCQCDEIYMPSIPGKKLDKPETYPFNIAVDVRRKVITLDLEKRVSQRKCHEYNMSIMNFGNNVNGIRNASNKYFSKELENLNESEILFLIKMLKSPTLYSSPKGKARLEYQIEQLIKRNKNKPNSVFKK